MRIREEHVTVKGGWGGAGMMGVGPVGGGGWGEGSLYVTAG